MIGKVVVVVVGFARARNWDEGEKEEVVLPYRREAAVVAVA